MDKNVKLNKINNFKIERVNCLTDLAPHNEICKSIIS